MGIKFVHKPATPAAEASPTTDDAPFPDSTEAAADPVEQSKKAPKAKKSAKTKKAAPAATVAPAAPAATVAADIAADIASGVATTTVEHVQPTATVGTTSKNKVEEVKQIPVGPIIVKHEGMANVGLSVAMTKNLGNYESIKYSVSLHMPSAPEALDATFKQVSDWVDGKMAEIAAELTDGE